MKVQPYQNTEIDTESPHHEGPAVRVPREVILAGIRTAVASRRDLTHLVVAASQYRRQKQTAERPKVMFDINGHAIWMADSDPAYREALGEADIVHADGQCIIFASRLLTDAPIPERSATTDLIHDVAAAAEEHRLSFFLLGATEDVNAKAAKVLKSRYPKLEIVGRRNGYFKPTEVPAIIAEINQAAPDVLWVGLGKPREQLFSLDHRDALDVAWIVTCGGCLNFLAGNYKRAPAFLQSLGLEWLHRMLTGPRYLIKRYTVSNATAIWLLLTRSKRNAL